jgi:hypothetical protein
MLQRILNSLLSPDDMLRYSRTRAMRELLSIPPDSAVLVRPEAEDKLERARR